MSLRQPRRRNGRAIGFAFVRIASLVMATAVTLPEASAATRTWTGAVNQVFGTVGNWNTGVPDAGDTALWGAASTSNLSISLSGSQAVRGLQLTSPGGAVSLGGSTLTINAGGIDMAAATQNLTITSNLTLGGGQAWDVASGQTLALATGTFTRSAGTALTLPGAGTVTSSMAGLANTNGIVGPWASIGTGAAARYVTLASGTLAAYTSGSTVAAFGWSSGNANTVNYDVGAVQGNLGVGRQANTARYTGTAGTQNWGNNNTTTITLNGLMNVGTGTLTFSESGGTSQGQLAVGTNNGNELVLSPVTSGITINIPIINTSTNAGAVTVAGPDTVTITSSGGTSTYTGRTTVAAGTLVVNGAGNINASSGLAINGANARYVHTSSVASTLPITLTSGTLDGTGAVGAVTVGDNTGGVVANGNGGSTALTTSGLTFLGDGILSLRKPADFTTAAVTVTGTLVTTPASGSVVVNLLSGPTWTSGSTYNLVGYGSFGGAASNFTLGTVAGLTSRQVATLGTTGATNGFLTMAVAGDNPYWTGGSNGDWNTTQTGNWRLVSAGTSTVFLTNDQVLFNDAATGTTTVDINAANVAVSGVTFANSTKDYTIGSTGGFGMTDGTGPAALVKGGTGSVTINTANSYSGGTTLNAGRLNLGNASALGTGGVTIAGGSLDNTSGSKITLATNPAQSWTGDFAFAGSSDGSHDLDMGTGTVTLGGTSGARAVNVAAGTLTVGRISGTAVGFTKTGAGTLTINPTAGVSSVTGTLTVADGTLNIGLNDFTANGLAGSGTIANGSATTRWLIITTASGATSTFAGALENGTGGGLLGLSKNGSGTLTLTGTSSYTDVTSLNAGTLVMASPLAFGNTSLIRMATASGQNNTLVFATDGGEQAYPATGSTGATVNLVSDRATPGAGIEHTLTTQNGANGVGGVTFNVTSGTNVTSGAGRITFTQLGLGAGSVQTTLFNPTTADVSLGDVSKQNNNVSQTLGLSGTSTDNRVTGVIWDGPALVSPNNVSVAKSGSSTWTLTGNNLYTGATTISGGTLRVGDGGTSGSLGTGTVTVNADLVFNRADTLALPNVVTGTGTITQAGLGTLTVTGSSGFAGTLRIDAGTVSVGDGGTAGSLGTASVVNAGTLVFNRSDDATFAGSIAGAGAVQKLGSSKLTLSGTGATTGPISIQAGTLAVTGAYPAASFTVDSGVLDGTGSAGFVTVGIGNTITNGNGGTGSLTLGSLSYSGLATTNLNVTSGSAGIIVTGALSTAPEAGQVTVNATNTLWTTGTHNLISFGGFSAALSDFTLGTLTGLTNRQNAGSLVLNGNNLAVVVNGESLVWSGRNGGVWTTVAAGSPVVAPNWALATAHSPANFWPSDIVEFRDTVNVSGTVSAPTTTNVSIQGGSVSPTSMTFTNTTLNYTIASTDGSGITSGFLVKNGAGALTISTSNSYAGGSTINAGTVTASSPAALGSGNVTLTGGTLAVNAADVTTSGSVSVSGGTLNASAASALGAGNVAVSGGTVNVATGASLGGGALTISGGTVNAAGSGLAAGGVTLAGGRLNLAANDAVTAGPITITGGTIGNASGTAVTIASAVNQVWSGTFATDSGSLAFTTGTATVSTPSALTLGGGLVAVNALVNNSRLTLGGSGTLSTTTTAFTSIGYLTTSATMTMTGGVFSTAGELRVGSSDTSGAAYNASGLFTVAGGTANLSALTVARGNNNQNTVSGTAAVTGGTVNSANDVILGYAGAGNTGALQISSGAFNVASAGTTKWLQVGVWDTSRGQIDISGGSLNLLQNSAIKMSRQTTTGANTINQTGGLVGFYSDSGSTLGGTGDLDLQYVGSASTVNTYNLVGGTLAVPRIISTAATGTRVFNFNGGTLKAVTTGTIMALGGGSARANVRNGGAVIDTSGFTVTLAQPLLHSDIGGDAATDGGLVKNGAGTLVVAAANTYTGATTVNDGVFQLNGSLTSNVTVNSGATIMGTGSSSGSLTLASGAALTASTTGTPLSFNGVAVTGPTTLALSGSVADGVPYTLFTYGAGGVTGTANFTSAYRISLTDDVANRAIKGTAQVLSLTWAGGPGTWVNAGGTTWVGGERFYAGDTVTFDGSAATSTATVEGTVLPTAISVSGTGATTFTGTGSIGGSASLAKSGAGTLTVSTSNSFTGGVTLAGGDLAIGNAAALGSGTLTLAGGSFSNATGAALALAGGPAAQAWNADVAFVGAVDGTKDLTMGTGLVTLGGDRTVTVAAGRLSVGALSGTGGFTKAGAGTLTLVPTQASAIGGTLDVAAGRLEIGAQDLVAGGLAGSGTIANGSNTTRWLVVTTATDSTFAGTLENGGGTGLLGLSKTGAGSLTLSGSSGYGDVTTVTSGTLQFSGAGSIANSSGYVLAAGSNATLKVDATGRIGNGTISIQSTGGIPNDSTNKLELAGNAVLSNPITFAQRHVTTAGAITPGILNTSGTSTLSGPITIIVGGSFTPVESAAGLLTLSGSISTSAGSNRNLVLQGAGRGVVSGVIANNAANAAGTVSVIKDGVGTWTLSAANTTSGSIAINAGTLLVNGTTGSGAVSVNAGGTLGGTGVVAGATTLAAGATLSPGASPGTLSFTQGLSWTGGANYNWQITSGTGTAGAIGGWDLLSTDGSLDIAATIADPFKLNLWTLSSTGPDVNGSMSGFDATQSYSWKIATAAGGVTNFSADKFTIVTGATNGTGGFANAYGSGTFGLEQSGNDINLVFTAGSSPIAITINVASGTQTQTQAGYPLLSGSLPVIKTGAGTLVVDQTNTVTGSTSIQGGVVRLASGNALGSSRIVPVAGGTLALTPFLQTNVGGLAPNAGGLTDVGSGLMTVSSGLSTADMLAGLLTGRGDGTWNGTSGITSSQAQADIGANIPRTVGWLDNGDGSVTFAFAAPGDTNLDWNVDILDAANFLAGGKFDSGTPASWNEGDFGYDGVVDILDAADFLSTGLFDAGPYNPPAGLAGGVAAVPEPSGVALTVLGLAAAVGIARRRRG